MDLEFQAQSVSYEEALGGDIIQVVLDENLDDGTASLAERSLYFSINYEFPPCDLLFEWAFGDEFGGGKAAKYSICNSELSVWLDSGSYIKVAFSTELSTYNKIVDLLQKEIGESFNNALQG